MPPSDFAIGYCPDTPWGEDGALARAAAKAGYHEKWLLSSGLCKKREDGTLYDFYRGRVMFPIRDVTGRFIGFGGRTLKTDKKVPKYVNSPESPLYDKSRALYGIHLARNAIVKADRAILVEGYTDVMAMRQAGVEHVVASSGTALTVEQVRLLRRFSKNITMLFDGDPAGLRAAIRGVDIVLGEGLDVKVAVLPDGEDPDTFAKRLGQEDLLAWLDTHSQDFIRFKIDLPTRRHGRPTSGPAGSGVVKSIAEVPDELKLSTCGKARRLGSSRRSPGRLGQQARAVLEKKANAPSVHCAWGGRPVQRCAPHRGWAAAVARSTCCAPAPLRSAPSDGGPSPEVGGTESEDAQGTEAGGTKVDEPNTVEASLAEVLLMELDTSRVAIRHPVVDAVLTHFREQSVPATSPARGFYSLRRRYRN